MTDKQLEERFKDKYKSLNKEQKLAVDTIDGPVMVIAGPGTGKTTILTLRIANILRQTDTPASGILALTFTEAGVKSMKMKLREIIGSRADEVRIHTFHGFAGSVISEFPDHFPHLRRTEQITDVEAEAFIREILRDKKYAKLRPLGEPDFFLQRIISSIAEAKKENWSPEYIKNFAKDEEERVRTDESSISTKGESKGSLKAEALKRIEKCERTTLFADVYREYEGKKKKKRKMDFDDLLYELLHTMKNDELLLRLLQEKFMYILVDEHQDTNESQNFIVSLLSNFFESPNLFVVGDEKQAIYRFQGASVQNFLKFQNAWEDMKIISLSQNYRSHQDILDASFKMIEQNYNDGEHEKLRVKLSSNSKIKKPIDIVFADDFTSIDAYMMEELRRIQEEDSDSTTAVILRWNKDVDHVMSLCEAYGIKASAERGADIFSHPLGSMYFKVLDYLSNPSKTEVLAETIAGGLWGFEISKAGEIIKKIRSGNIANLNNEIPALKQIEGTALSRGVIDYLIFVGEVSGLINEKRLRNPMYVEVWRAVIDLAKDISTSNNLSDSREVIRKLLDYKETSERKTIKVKSGKSSAKIEIMTAHSSKGLEYDYVFLPYALEEFWVRRAVGSAFVLPFEKDNSDDLKDTRRLFYVALTRAKKHAVILVPEQDNLGGTLTPLRFISELNEKSLKKIKAKKSNVLPKTIPSKDYYAWESESLLEYTKDVIKENGLSVTALNHFMNCPSEFIYKSILKVPEAPNGTSEKGIAMHKAMSAIWNSKTSDVSSITKTIIDTAGEYMKYSLLMNSQKEVIMDDIAITAPVVARALSSHFDTNAKVFTDRWVNKEFRTRINNKEIEISLHGQLDSIVDTPNKTLVFDYKTKEGMSLNETKGLTKNSDGGYFRQLIFYKMLLSGSNDFKDKEVDPALVFIKPDDKGRCPIISLEITQNDVKRAETEINTLLESVYLGTILDSRCDDKKCKWCSIRLLGK